MSLSEVELPYFLLPVLALYWLLPRRAALQNALLFFASLVFYATWNAKLLPLLLLGTAIDFAILRALAKRPNLPDEAPEAERAAVAKARYRLLVLSLTTNLVVLAGFKYIGLANAALHLGLPAIALPLGLSFYTMARMGVVIDVYYERSEAPTSWLSWFTFTSFFPQLIAGPIGRTSLLVQYDKPRTLSPDQALRSIGDITVGLLLKIYVAAQIGPAWVDPVFGAAGTFTRKAHAMAVLGYGIQVFGDFAGYSLIAIGVGRLFGLQLPDNFNFPFVSTSPPEVWRRWHMSLNNWLFDYVYSLMTTGRTFMRGRLGLGFVVVMLLSGVWHGSTLTYVVWGLLHGVWLLLHYRYDLYYKSLCRKDRAWVKRRKSPGYVALAWVATIGFFFLTLIPFRASSLAVAGRFVTGLVAGGSEVPDSGGGHPWLAVLLVIAYHVVYLPRFEKLRVLAGKLPTVVLGIVLAIAVMFLLMFAPIGAGTFIYAQF